MSGAGKQPPPLILVRLSDLGLADSKTGQLRICKQAADELEKYLKLDPKAADAEKLKKTIADLRK